MDFQVLVLKLPNSALVRNTNSKIEGKSWINFPKRYDFDSFNAVICDSELVSHFWTFGAKNYKMQGMIQLSSKLHPPLLLAPRPLPGTLALPLPLPLPLLPVAFPISFYFFSDPFLLVSLAWIFKGIADPLSFFGTCRDSVLWTPIMKDICRCSIMIHKARFRFPKAITIFNQ